MNPEDYIDAANLAVRALPDPVTFEINSATLLSIRRLRQRGKTFIEIGRRHGMTYLQVRAIVRVLPPIA